MRSRFGILVALLSLFPLIGLTTLCGPVSAFEKRAVRDDSAGDDSWAAGATCSIVYWNRCTLWGYSWSGLGDKAVIGSTKRRHAATAGKPAGRKGIEAIVPFGQPFASTIERASVPVNP